MSDIVSGSGGSSDSGVYNEIRIKQLEPGKTYTIPVGADSFVIKDVCSVPIYGPSRPHTWRVCRKDGETYLFIGDTERKTSKWIALTKWQAVRCAYRLLQSALLGIDP